MKAVEWLWKKKST